MPTRSTRESFDWPVAAVLAALGGVYAWTALNFAGTTAAEWNTSMLALGLVAALSWIVLFRRGRAPQMSGWQRFVVGLLPAYALLQVIPLPIAVVDLLSPHRAEVHRILSQAVEQSSFVTISVLPSATVVHVLQIAVYLSVFLLLREITWRIGWWVWAAIIPILLVAAGEAALGWLHNISVAGASPASGTFINRNHFAGMLEMSLPFAVMYPLAVARSGREGRSLSLSDAIKMSIGFGLATLILMGIVFSFSRSGFSAALAGLVAMATLGAGQALSGRAKGGVLTLVLLAVSAAFFLLPPDAFIQRFADLSTVEEIQSQDRLELWTETWDLIEAYPLVGSGLGAYRAAFLEFKVTTPMVSDDHAHNDYLQCLAELGLLGTLIVAAIVISFVRSALRARVKHPTIHGRYMAVACFGAMFAIALHSVTDFNLYIPVNAMLLAWVAGVASGLDASGRFHRGDTQWRHRQRSARSLTDA